MGATGGGLRGILRLLSPAHSQKEVGDGHRAFPIDDYGQQPAIDVHDLEPGLAVFADFDHDAHPSRLARAFSSLHRPLRICPGHGVKLPACNGNGFWHSVSALVPRARFPEEPGAVIPHAGICEGAPGNRCPYLNRS